MADEFNAITYKRGEGCSVRIFPLLLTIFLVVASIAVLVKFVVWASMWATS